MMRQEISQVNKLKLAQPDQSHAWLVPSLPEKCLISQCCSATNTILTTRERCFVILLNKAIKVPSVALDKVT